MQEGEQRDFWIGTKTAVPSFFFPQAIARVSKLGNCGRSFFFFFFFPLDRFGLKRDKRLVVRTYRRTKNRRTVLNVGNCRKKCQEAYVTVTDAGRVQRPSEPQFIFDLGVERFMDNSNSTYGTGGASND